MKQIIINNISTSYYITEDGKCYNTITNKYLKGQENPKNGYHSYNLTLPDGSKKRCYTHRLVAAAYLPQPTEQQTEVNHIDGNKLNNNADNLEWVTPAQNQQHALDMELRAYAHVYCFNPEQQLVAEYKNVKEASFALNIAPSRIYQEINKETKTLTNGFYWSKSKTLGPIKEYTNTGRAKKVNQYDLNGKYITTYNSTGIASRAINANSSHISECCRGKIKTYKGFIWRYVDDIVSPFDESQRDIAKYRKK